MTCAIALSEAADYQRKPPRLSNLYSSAILVFPTNFIPGSVMQDAEEPLTALHFALEQQAQMPFSLTLSCKK